MNPVNQESPQVNSMPPGYQPQSLDLDQSRRSRSDEIDLVELFKVLWSAKFQIIGTSLLFGCIAAIYAFSLPNIYRAETLLAPAEAQSNGASALVSQFGGLASLAGVNLGGGGDNVTKAIATLKSRQFIKYFIDKYDLKVPLMATQWDRELGRNMIDPEVYDESQGIWLSSDSDLQLEPPTDWEVYKEFKNILFVSEDKKNGLITIAIEWTDPQLAKEWVNLLAQEINFHFKKIDSDEAKRSIDFLKEQLEKTQLVDMQNAFYQLIEQQTKTVMLADVRSDYVFSVIDLAVVPEDKISPRRLLMFLLGLSIGGIIIIFILLVRNTYQISLP